LLRSSSTALDLPPSNIEKNQKNNLTVKLIKNGCKYPEQKHRVFVFKIDTKLQLLIYLVFSACYKNSSNPVSSKIIIPFQQEKILQQKFLLVGSILRA
jgi:hypothetical protein